MNKLFHFFMKTLPSMWCCVISGLEFQSTMQLRGRVRIIKRNWLMQKLLHMPNGEIIIGKNFKCNNKVTSNSIGLIQPCVFNIGTPGSKIIIGDNVGISGSTICATKSVTIGNNVLIGSGCIITDTDAHPIDWRERREGNKNKASSPVVIGDDVFIGARSIILKGVTIGNRAVIGAGSVVVKDVPSDCVVAGNPARVVKRLLNK